MKLSTRPRYGLRLMLALARNYGKGNTFLKDIALEEGISEKYLSLIIIPLKGVGLVNSVRGSSGGYTLAKAPSQITLKDIVDVMEGDCLVDCLKDPKVCSRVSTCTTRDVWTLLGGKISETLSSITLEQLVAMNNEKKEQAISPSI
ncbi:MAG: Rrf2 family transcriptional regulator [Syntrophaceae bacterium]|nr:Rrf2 family transcriptional regulator [Syntrophaceae bacterium]